MIIIINDEYTLNKNDSNILFWLIKIGTMTKIHIKFIVFFWIPIHFMHATTMMGMWQSGTLEILTGEKTKKFLH